jgi:hypothetical protein
MIIRVIITATVQFQQIVNDPTTVFFKEVSHLILFNYHFYHSPLFLLLPTQFWYVFTFCGFYQSIVDDCVCKQTYLSFKCMFMRLYWFRLAYCCSYRFAIFVYRWFSLCKFNTSRSFAILHYHHYSYFTCCNCCCM